MSNIYLVEFDFAGFGCRRVVVADNDVQAREVSNLTDIATIESVKKIGIADEGVEIGIVCAEEP